MANGQGGVRLRWFLFGLFSKPRNRGNGDIRLFIRRGPIFLDVSGRIWESLVNTGCIHLCIEILTLFGEAKARAQTGLPYSGV